MDINQGQKDRDYSFELQMRDTFASTSLEEIQQEVNYVNTEIWTNVKETKKSNSNTGNTSNSRG